MSMLQLWVFALRVYLMHTPVPGMASSLALFLTGPLSLSPCESHPDPRPPTLPILVLASGRY